MDLHLQVFSIVTHDWLKIAAVEREFSAPYPSSRVVCINQLELIWIAN